MRNLNKLENKIDKILKKYSKEEIEEIKKHFHPEIEIPKGWVSIEDHLPSCPALDFISKGFIPIKVKDKNNKEFEFSLGGDSLSWYYDVKKLGIEYWWNE